MTLLHEIVLDAPQKAVAQRLAALAGTLRAGRPRWHGLFGGATTVPRGVYLWGNVGRGKTMLMDEFFEEADIAAKRRVHFSAFMVETHARLHTFRTLDPRVRPWQSKFARGAGIDPFPAVAHAVASEAGLLCFDEFQVRDVADAMILGRLFEQLLARDVTIVATSNTPPRRLYEGGLNRQLFLPFISLLVERLDVVALENGRDYRLGRMAGLNLYVTPPGTDATATLDAAWAHLTDGAAGESERVPVLGREVRVPRAAHGAARFGFDELCGAPLGAADYLAIAHRYHVVMIDRIPIMERHMQNEERRFTVLIDILYDEGVKLICSAAAAPEALFSDGSNADAFHRTASRLVEMQSLDYLERTHRPRIAEPGENSYRAYAG